MKYNGDMRQDAIYSQELSGNPFLDALPELISKKDFMEQICSFPGIPYNLNQLSSGERRKHVMDLDQLFIPMDYMYNIYDLLYRAIISNYKTHTMKENIRQINEIYWNDKLGKPINNEYSTQSYSGAILGVPGIGKTSTIRRCLQMIPQVITHQRYYNEIFYYKQITYLMVECPSDCSLKALSLNIISAVDKAIGSNYFIETSKAIRLSASALAIKVKIICANHHVGVLVIDEIQNAVLSAKKNHNTTPLIKFLVELTNETCLSICFSGTPYAEELFSSQEHLKRRTRGLRLLPMKPDKAYIDFINKLWTYQMTLKKTTINEEITNLIYNYSSGIPYYIIKIFQEAQIEAIISGQEILSKAVIRKAMEIQNIAIPKLYKQGTSLSAFIVDDFEIDLTGDINDNKDFKFHVSKKGRKAVERSYSDIILTYKRSASSEGFIKTLSDMNLVETIIY